MLSRLIIFWTIRCVSLLASETLECVLGVAFNGHSSHGLGLHMLQVGILRGIHHIRPSYYNPSYSIVERSALAFHTQDKLKGRNADQMWPNLTWQQWVELLASNCLHGGRNSNKQLYPTILSHRCDDDNTLTFELIVCCHAISLVQWTLTKARYNLHQPSLPCQSNVMYKNLVLLPCLPRLFRERRSLQPCWWAPRPKRRCNGWVTSWL